MQIKSFRLLFIFLQSKDYIGQSQNRSDGLELNSKVMTGLIAAISFSSWKSFAVMFRALDNWCCHYVNVCKIKPPRGNKHVSKYFQLRRL